MCKYKTLVGSQRILKYEKGTVDCAIKYARSDQFQLVGFSDNDQGGSADDMKSTTGYCFSLGSGMISWCSKKQEIVAQSTAEAEFVAATAAANQAIWLRKILQDLCLD